MSDSATLENVQPRWHLLGAGSLGCLFAAYLQRAGVALELIVRDTATLRQLHANGGITLARDDERTTIAVAAAEPGAVRTPIEHLLVCTKAQQTLAAIDSIKSHLAPAAVIVLLQNGMGVRELLQNALPDATILNALSTEGAFRSARFEITHAGHGETVIGAAAPQQRARAEQTVQALQCELPIAHAADIEHRLWLKLAVNSVINPLTALHRCRNGELSRLAHFETIIAQLCDELAQVAHAENIELNAAQMRDGIYRVIRVTAGNKSSMLQDVEAGRPTEIDCINGFIVERARAHGLAHAQHEGLVAAIHALDPSL